MAENNNNKKEDQTEFIYDEKYEKNFSNGSAGPEVKENLFGNKTFINQRAISNN